MTARALFARAQRLLVGVVLVVSGTYLLVYLYRWEWNRAIVSGLFFLASEVALATSMLVRRLTALERNQGSRPSGLDRLRQTPIDRPNPFAWLAPRSGAVSVFVPVLLGAGAILSALAYVVERVAEATAVPLVDRRIAARLSEIAPPSGLGAAGADRPQRALPADRVTVASTLLAIGAIGVVGWLGISTLLDATQSRPDAVERPERTTIELAVSHRSDPDRYAAAADALWEGCRATVGSVTFSGRIADLGGGRVALILEPGIGDLRTRRLVGCLTDLRVNFVLARVVSVESTP